MLMQNSKRPPPENSPSKADSGLLREDHLVLWAIDAVLAAHAAVRRWWQRWQTGRSSPSSMTSSSAISA